MASDLVLTDLVLTEAEHALLEESGVRNREVVPGPQAADAEVLPTRPRRSYRRRNGRSKDTQEAPPLAVGAVAEVPSISTGKIGDGFMEIIRTINRGRDSTYFSEGRYNSDPSVSRESFTFRATLSSSGSSLNVDSDGQTKITLEVPASDLASVLKLLLYRNKAFTVEIS